MKKMKIILVWLMLIITIGLTACGKKDEGDGAAEKAEYVYVPEFKSLDFGDVNTYSMIMKGENFYFPIYNFDEETGMAGTTYSKWNINSESMELEQLPISFGTEDGQSDVYKMTMDEEGNVYAILNVYPVVDENFDYEEYSIEYYLCKYHPDYSLATQVNITKEMNKDENNNYPQDMLVDPQGRIYIQCNNLVRVFDENCQMIAEISIDGDWINVMGMSKEGKVYVGEYNYTSDSYGFQLLELDVENNGIGAKYSEGIPDTRFMVPGLEKGALLAGDNSLFSYDFATNTLEKILDWTNCNINGSSIENLDLLPDGRILVVTRDYSTGNGESELAILTKTKASEVDDKQVITVASLYSNYELQNQVVAFNKANPLYQVRVNVYIDDNAEWTDTTYSDAITRLNNDLTGQNAPDIIDLSFQSDLSDYASKGLLEDLTPYLENSASLIKDDFLEPVLDNFTYDGKLVALARQFNIRTIYGKEKFFGEYDGFTMDELFEFVNENPDKPLFQDKSKMGMFSRLATLSFNEFIDYSTGSCDFENDNFKKILELSNTQKSVDYQYDSEVSLPELLQTDQVLLNEVYISDMYSYIMYTKMFEEDAVLVGYPTADGSKGVILECYNPYAIVATSKNKDVAWKFMESLYQYTPNENQGYYQFSALKAEMEDMYKEAMEKEYSMDWMTGEYEKDENGELIEIPKTSWGYDNWNVDIYAATQEEVDTVKELIEMASPSNNYMDEKISEIILEEVEPYFLGKKSVEETMDVIQRRVDLYLGENY